MRKIILIIMLAEELLAFGLDKNYLVAQAEGNNIQGISWYVRGDYPKGVMNLP
jgi:hypothetical protein